MTRIINNSSDPDISVSEDGAAPTNNIMSTLREELKRKIENKPLTLAIPSREGVSIKFNTNIEAGLIQQWRKRASDKTMPDGTPRKLMDTSKINNFGWSPSITLAEGIKRTILEVYNQF